MGSLEVLLSSLTVVLEVMGPELRRTSTSSRCVRSVRLVLKYVIERMTEFRTLGNRDRLL
jgi:hypothetical protein